MNWWGVWSPLNLFDFCPLASLRFHQKHRKAELRQRAHVQTDCDCLRLWKEPGLRGRPGQDQRQAHLQTQLARYQSLRPSVCPPWGVSLWCTNAPFYIEQLEAISILYISSCQLICILFHSLSLLSLSLRVQQEDWIRAWHRQLGSISQHSLGDLRRANRIHPSQRWTGNQPHREGLRQGHLLREVSA